MQMVPFRHVKITTTGFIMDSRTHQGKCHFADDNSKIQQVSCNKYMIYKANIINNHKIYSWETGVLWNYYFLISNCRYLHHPLDNVQI
jgi:hypothetical protein